MQRVAVLNLWALIPISEVASSEFKHLLKLSSQGTGQLSTFLHLTQSSK